MMRIATDTRLRLIAAVIAAALVHGVALACPPIVYVDASAPPGGDGESWATAFQDLQEALALARGCAGAVEEVWMAEGVYRPAPPDGDPDLRFELVDGLSMYGGFPAGGAPFEQRDTDAYPTILSGELGRIDSRQVLRARDLVTGVRLEGFTIRDAWDDRRLGGGGGAEVTNSTATLIDCDIIENHAESGGALLIVGSRVDLIGCRLDDNDVFDEGGAVKVEDSTVSFADTTIVGNIAATGGGVWCDESELHFENCDITDNTASGGRGGALVVDTATITFGNGRIDGNLATGGNFSAGGAVYAYNSTFEFSDSFINRNVVMGDADFAGGGAFDASSCEFTFSRCGLSANAAICSGDYAQGGLIDGEYSSVSFFDCQVIGNYTDCGYEVWGGGAIGMSRGDFVAHDTVFRDNYAVTERVNGALAVGGAVMMTSPNALEATVDIRRCTFFLNSIQSYAATGAAIRLGYVTGVIDSCVFERNSIDASRSSYVVRGGAVDITTSDMIIRNCTFSHNTIAGGDGGALAFWAREWPLPVLGCTFIGNSVVDGAGGALHLQSEALALVQNCVFLRNQAAPRGGGGAIGGEGAVQLLNCLLAQNEADGSGGAIFGWNTEAINCTIAGNRANQTGGAAYGVGIFKNCILWDNEPNQFSGTMSIDYSNVDGGELINVGAGNTTVSPQFVDPDNDDYRLAPGSRMIDAGENAALPPDILRDLDGAPRFHDDPSMPDSGAGDPPIVDLGAYEFQGDSKGFVFTVYVEPDPLVAGAPAEISTVAAAPETIAYVIRSIHGEGANYVPELNLVVDLTRPNRIGAPKLTNAAGAARWTFDVPRRGSGETVWIQVVQHERKSNVERREIK